MAEPPDARNFTQGIKEYKSDTEGASLELRPNPSGRAYRQRSTRTGDSTLRAEKGKNRARKGNPGYRLRRPRQIPVADMIIKKP
jgi:hypothetical protein